MAVFVRREGRVNTPIDLRIVRGLAERMLRKLGLTDSELSILLCSDRVIHELNLEHRGKDKPTDVLSFPQAEFESAEQPRVGESLQLLGDVVISVDTAALQAASRKRSVLSEVRFLLAHGLLHLLGHDHVTVEDKRIMFNRTRQLVRAAPVTEAARAGSDGRLGRRQKDMSGR